jgi:Transposase DDE domain
MVPAILDEEWLLLTEFLPSDWRELAQTEGAIRRQRGITDPEALLRLLLLHVASGLSLRQAVARATVLGWPSMSDVALLKRLRTSEAWLRALATRMYETSRFGARKHKLPDGRRIRVVDATTVEEPGATGTDWRVHYSLRLPGLACDFYELTDVDGGETYKRFPVEQGDIILADRVYANREGVAHVIRAKGDVVVRLTSTNLPLLHPSSDRPFELLSHLRKTRRRVPSEWDVCFKLGRERFQARLCALRKTRTAAEKAQKHARRRANRKGEQIKPETLECAEFVFVLTTVSRSELPAPDVLELYRVRWQVELIFKRLKSLLRLGHLPKHTDQSARAWIQAKLLTALIIEHLADKARFFSPWGFDLKPSQSLA